MTTWNPRPLPRHGRGSRADVERRAQQRPGRGQGASGKNGWRLLGIVFFLGRIIRGWVKTLVPSEPQVIAGIYGCE